MNLSIFSINGDVVISAEVQERPMAMAITPDGRHILLGGERKLLAVRQLLRWPFGGFWLTLPSLRVVFKYDPLDMPITALTISHDGAYVLVGCSNGSFGLCPFNIEEGSARNLAATLRG